MNRYSRKNSFSKTLKDYLVPLLGLFLIVILFYSFFSGASDQVSGSGSSENQLGYALTLGGVDTEAYVVYTGEKKEALSSNKNIYKGEKVIVKEGHVSLLSPGKSKINIDRLGEFKINEDGSYGLYSSNIWIENPELLTVQMRYATAQISANSVVSMAQNEVGSTLYVLKGSVEVKNLAGVSSVLGKEQKITISRTEASNKSADLSGLKASTDSFFRSSDWFTKNNGSLVVENGQKMSSTGSTLSGSTVEKNKQSLLSFSGFLDESTTADGEINISGSFLRDDVSIISANNTLAVIDSEKKTFLLSNVATTQKENDIIIKVYSSSKELLEKNVFTVYSLQGAATASTAFQVENYSLDATEFQFISPKQNPYTSSEDVVMIEGRVPVGTVKKIVINGFTLQKFPQYGSYWAYFANKEFGNLKDGLNIYKVQYYDTDENILHNNTFTIVSSPAIEKIAGNQTGTGVITSNQ